jgi:hypothetical protein
VRVLSDALSQLSFALTKWQARGDRRIFCSGKIEPLPVNDGSTKEIAPSFGRPVRPRILSYRWHVPHQYELHKLPWDFTLLTDFSGRGACWDLGQRPLRPNVRLARLSEINLKDFDLAILHFDENCLHPERADGVLGARWGAAFKWFRENIDIPSIAVCHSGPPYRRTLADSFEEKPDNEERDAFLDYLSDIPVVVNSHQAQREWGFKRSRVIWHGFDPGEFPLAESGQGILSLSESALSQLPLYRGKRLYDQVVKLLDENDRPMPLRVKEPAYALRGNDYAYAKFRNFVDAVSTRGIYFNPTRRSPMPRSRGEAMMCGLVSVSANNHDVGRFIENGWNGYFSDDPDEIADILNRLLHDHELCRQIGRRSRETACEKFGISRYLSEWTEVAEQWAQ